MHGDAAISLFSLVCVLFSLLLGCLGTVFWIWMLVDCLAKEPSQGNEKVIWALVIVLTHALGGLLYYLIRRPQRIRQYGK
jgi:phospholipase D-like protein